MPKRTDIKKILLVGSGPIIIGQACEFDYSGTQACKALKEEGYEIVLVNSNPATIMTDPAFPAPAIGTVHLENSITAHRPVRVGETLGVAARVEPARPHAKGRVFDFVTTITDPDGAPVWESTSSYLRRGKGDDGAPAGLDIPVTPSNGVMWSLPGDLGRRYGTVSGDLNPIHLYPVTAKALGFPRQIAHGMWSLARCVAALENRLPDAVTVDVAFKKPILLPGKVAFGSERYDGSYTFSLTDPRTGAPHLVGRTTAR